MISSIVVSLRADSNALGHFQARVTRAANQVEALGGTICAFGPASVSFAFHGVDLEDVLEWATETVSREQAQPVLAGGIAYGELSPVGAGSGTVALGWGPALVVSAALAESAHGQEVLIDPDLPEVGSVVRSTGTRFVKLGASAIAAISVDPRTPLLRDQRSAFPPPISDAPGEPDEASNVADQARKALIRGDIAALGSALEQLKPTDAQPAWVDRLTGLLAIDQGANEDALRTLRHAADAEEPSPMKTRALLAYAIALASANRLETALLESLSALALARRMEDHAGVAACARLLSKLSKAAGHKVAASAWEHVVESSIAAAMAANA